MGIAVLLVFLPIIIPLLIVGFVILFNTDKWTGEKKAVQDYIKAYYDEYVHSENSPAYKSIEKTEV